MTSPQPDHPVAEDMDETITAPQAQNVAYEDVDDIIGIVSEMTALDDDSLSVEDVEDVAAQLEIAPQFVGPAIKELRRRRQAKLAKEAARRNGKRLLAVAAGLALLTLVIWAFIGQSALTSRWSIVDKARNQVLNVVERKVATTLLWQDAPASAEKQAELSGAENRVRIERRNYDEAAAAYNVEAHSFPGSLWCSLFGVPCNAPMSREISQW